MLLNERAAILADAVAADAERLRIGVSRSESGTRLIDCGVTAVGGLDAGLKLAETCLAGLGRVDLVPGRESFGGLQDVVVRTDHPLAACMASQYAGQHVAHEKYFAMGSGPMRAATAKEPLFEEIGFRERPAQAVGILETHKLPPDVVCRRVAEDCHIPAEALTLLVARTASLAGTMQVVARSIETALHKLHVLKFDLARLDSGFGVAPLPPVAKNDLAAIGWTNDAVLYGGEVTLWVRGDDDSLAQIGPQVPSSASPAFGEPFAVLFEKAGRDFYKLDPLLFSPARVTFHNLDTGRRQSFGATRPDVLLHSLGT